MFFHVCLLALFLVANSQGQQYDCTGTPDEATLKGLFCPAGVVAFSGYAVGGRSARGGRGPGGVTISTQILNCQVDHFLKGSEFEDAGQISVARTIRSDVQCNFPESRIRSPHAVYFGQKLGRYVQVDQCYVAPQWECLPESFRHNYDQEDYCN